MAAGSGSVGATVLLIEDDPNIAGLLRDVLEPNGYHVWIAENGAQAKAKVDEAQPDLIILDLMLPDADGLVLCADLRARADVPIVICSATPEKRDSILAFKLGADDFIAKPFVVDELLARIEAVMRRAVHRAPPETPLAPPAPALVEGQHGTRTERIGALTIDHARRHVTLGDVEVVLTPTEYRLLAALVTRPDEVFSRQELAQVVWGYEDASIGRSIDVHIHRLRSKLLEAEAQAGVAPPQIVSVRGFGYKIAREDHDASAA